MLDCPHAPRSKARPSTANVANDDTYKLLSYLAFLEATPCIRVQDSHTDKEGVIRAKLFYMGSPSTFDYFDERVMDFCHILAEDMREVAGRNVFFDLQEGNLSIY